jgi:RNA polymerase sigma factor (sigma-70 family)
MKSCRPLSLSLWRLERATRGLGRVALRIAWSRHLSNVAQTDGHGGKEPGWVAGGWLAREAEFTALYRGHSRRILGFFAARVSDPQAALDLTAETFARAFAGRHRFRGGTEGEAAAWLFGIASQLLTEFLRKGYAERRLVRRLGVVVPVVDEELERVIELDAARRWRPTVAQELDRLSAEQRDAVRLRVIDELGYAAIASRLGISEPAARMRVSRGLSALAHGLKDGDLIGEER